MSDKPWFVRVRSPLSYKLQPYSREGWIVTAIYVLGAIGMGLIHTRWQLPKAGMVAWGIIFALWTIGFLVVAFRHSESAEVRLVRDEGQ